MFLRFLLNAYGFLSLSGKLFSGDGLCQRWSITGKKKCL